MGDASEATRLMPPAKVVVVDASSARRESLAKALIEAGYEVLVAPSGLFAVTMMESEHPDLVVSGAQVHDMDGYELLTLLRNDPTTSAMPFVLLAGDDRSIALAATEAGADIAITGDITAGIVVTQVGELVRRRSVRGVSSPPRGVEVAGEALSAESGRAALEGAEPASSDPLADCPDEGSLERMDLAGVIRAIALSGRTGCLIVSLTGGAGAVLFETGRVIHAGFRGHTGEPAFAALLSAAEAQAETKAETRFRFTGADHAAVIHLPKTISRTVEQLLPRLVARDPEPGAGP
jgi:CheY-like chemotaxis protein